MLALTLFACAAPGPSVTPAAPADTLSLAVDLRERGAELYDAETMLFGWIETVFGYGAHRTYLRTGDAADQSWYRLWVLDELPGFEGTDPRTFSSSDAMSPAILASVLMQEDGGLDLSPITDAADAYLDTVPTTDEGAIVHWGESPFFDSDEVWVDSQFMWGVYLLREYERTGDETRLDTFVTQYQLFSDLCRDPADQLYRHAYKDETDSNIPEEDSYWARGNSWVLVSAAEFLSTAPPEHPGYDAVHDLFVSHAEATLALQGDDGMWHTVMNQPRGDDPANYTETSGSALIGYAVTRQRHDALAHLDTGPVLQALIDELESRITVEDGSTHLGGTSLGTNPGDYDDYTSIGLLDDAMLGLGASAMFLAEVHGEAL